MTISTDGFRIPVTVQLDARTYRAIHVAAERASEAAHREVTMRELIETRLAEAVTGVGRPSRRREPATAASTAPAKRIRGDRLTADELNLLHTMNDAGASAREIAAAVGCHTATVAYHRNKLRAHRVEGTSNV